MIEFQAREIAGKPRVSGGVEIDCLEGDTIKIVKVEEGGSTTTVAKYLIPDGKKATGVKILIGGVEEDA